MSDGVVIHIICILVSEGANESFYQTATETKCVWITMLHIFIVSTVEKKIYGQKDLGTLVNYWI